METILAFMDKGGNVLWLIAILLFVMWTLIFERLWFFNFVWRKEVYEVINAWESRSERKSWYAKQVRERLLSISREDIHANLNLITTLVALCPLLGLLGTVLGMIDIFKAVAGAEMDVALDQPRQHQTALDVEHPGARHHYVPIDVLNHAGPGGRPGEAEPGDLSKPARTTVCVQDEVV